VQVEGQIYHLRVISIYMIIAVERACMCMAIHWRWRSGFNSQFPLVVFLNDHVVQGFWVICDLLVAIVGNDETVANLGTESLGDADRPVNGQHHARA
jgi:hypothetical protein